MHQEDMEPNDNESRASREPDSSNDTLSRPKKRHRWVWVVVLFLFALLFFAVLRRGETKAATAPNRRGMMGPVPVTTVTAKLGSIGVYLDAIGTVTPVYTNSITAQVTGIITNVYYREGQVVARGTPLIDLDARLYEAQLEQAEGTLERDQNLLAQAQMDLERYQAAWSRNAIPRQTLEDQEKLVKQYQGTVKTDQGLVHYYQVEVAYCHITSPIEGRVGLRLVDPGNLVAANSTTPLVVITQTQPITVIFTIAEDNLGEVLDQLRRGVKLSVEAWDRQMNKQISTGELTTVDNQIDTTTGTVKLRARFTNAHNELFPNEFVNTRLAVEKLDNQILVPDSAVQHNGETAFVYLIQNGEAKITNVKVGVTNAGIVAVQGIHPGDVLADSSFEKLQNGSKVTISKVQMPSRPTASNAP
ncbi:MAG TPA: efflux RND transporter periplasmic adaptor subunit [Terriglobales bacterium]|nr:efflux RND transporter periplasmic adaptor subunit [Terriglobales bacterium]